MRGKRTLEHVGDGKSKETAIYFLNARHSHEEDEFADLWMEANNKKFPKAPGEEDNPYAYDGPEGHYEYLVEKDADYLVFNTLEGKVWFKMDRGELKMEDYFNWLDEQGV